MVVVGRRVQGGRAVSRVPLVRACFRQLTTVLDQEVSPWIYCIDIRSQDANGCAGHSHRGRGRQARDGGELPLGR